MVPDRFETLEWNAKALLNENEKNKRKVREREIERVYVWVVEQKTKRFCDRVCAWVPSKEGL
jgi:hypothetical protein